MKYITLKLTLHGIVITLVDIRAFIVLLHVISDRKTIAYRLDSFQTQYMYDYTIHDSNPIIVTDWRLDTCSGEHTLITVCVVYRPQYVIMLYYTEHCCYWLRYKNIGTYCHMSPLPPCLHMLVMHYKILSSFKYSTALHPTFTHYKAHAPGIKPEFYTHLLFQTHPKTDPVERHTRTHTQHVNNNKTVQRHQLSPDGSTWFNMSCLCFFILNFSKHNWEREAYMV